MDKGNPLINIGKLTLWLYGFLPRFMRRFLLVDIRPGRAGVWPGWRGLSAVFLSGIDPETGFGKGINDYFSRFPPWMNFRRQSAGLLVVLGTDR
ncbi:hypothetical protein [Spirosoma radiotolerans]|uniref:Uncharacterized protein n=1 Tax=Spirosoma radiotolerans TaxID=1379870 RepID=A0A0E3ZTS0_9BACT|nr:hypothetical protein [Spirosoma radiotolerans]AKD55180.1 hypothetical protein SD10_09955 [Spirosoma radiotolerans]